MTPEQINAEHGKPVWTCWHCKAETGLHWHNGWSVALCDRPECAKAYNEMCAAQIAAEDAYERYEAEYLKGQR